GWAPFVGLRNDCARRREWVIAEFLRPRLEQHRRLVPLQRRQRIVALARRLEHIAAVDLIALQIAGLAGTPDLRFGLLLEWPQHRIGQGPVSERAFLRDRSEAISLDGVRARAKIVLMQAPRYGAIVDGAAARLVAVVLRGNPHRPFVPVRPPRHWLPF